MELALVLTVGGVAVSTPTLLPSQSRRSLRIRSADGLRWIALRTVLSILRAEEQETFPARWESQRRVRLDDDRGVMRLAHSPTCSPPAIDRLNAVSRLMVDSDHGS